MKITYRCVDCLEIVTPNKSDLCQNCGGEYFYITDIQKGEDEDYLITESVRSIFNRIKERNN